MNPFNWVWVILTWILVAGAVVLVLFNEAHGTVLAILVLGMLGVMITGQTIGADRAEKAWEAERQRLTESAKKL